jgi:hypothetical protein
MNNIGPIVRSILRLVCVSTVCFSVLLALGAGFLKSALAGFTAFVFFSVGLGRVLLEQLAVWSTILLIVHWAGLLPIGRWLNGVIIMIDRALT